MEEQDMEAGQLLREAEKMLRKLSEMFGQGVPALMYQPGLQLADRIDKLLAGDGLK